LVLAKKIMVSAVIFELVELPGEVGTSGRAEAERLKRRVEVGRSAIHGKLVGKEDYEIKESDE
jgi:hypothetical protein